MVLRCIVGNGVACCSMVLVLKYLFVWLMQVASAEEVFSLSAGSVWQLGVVFCAGRVDCFVLVWSLGAVGLFEGCRPFNQLRCLSLIAGACFLSL